MAETDSRGWQLHALAWLLALAAITAYAATTKTWFLTAASVGFLFGVVTLLANWGMASIYLMGGQTGRRLRAR